MRFFSQLYEFSVSRFLNLSERYFVALRDRHYARNAITAAKRKNTIPFGMVFFSLIPVIFIKSERFYTPFMSN